jgi:hypothetical protein
MFTSHFWRQTPVHGGLLCMAEIQTSRVHRTWPEKFLLWRRAYQTKIFAERREVFGRGPTPETSQEDAERRWVAEAESTPHPEQTHEAR